MVDKIKQADFSKESDFKSELRQQLFGHREKSKKGNVIESPMRFKALSMEELEMVNAAGDKSMMLGQNKEKEK